MQAIKCELCGSNSFTKEDGYFVCNHCNTKYTLEEAKKMMIEGTVNVKVDDSEELNKLYQIARRARDEENNQNAAKYYEMILMKDPSSWEANFYTVYFQAMSCKIGEIPTAATSVNNCISNTFKLIKEMWKKENVQLAKSIIKPRKFLICFLTLINHGIGILILLLNQNFNPSLLVVQQQLVAL